MRRKPNNGCNPALTEAQAAEVERRYRLGRQHSTKAIAAALGVDVCTVRKYAQGFRPLKWGKQCSLLPKGNRP